MEILNFLCLLIVSPITACNERKPGVYIEKGNLITQYDRKAKGTIIILHGHGSTGEDLRFWMSITNRGGVRFSHLRAIFPSGVVKPHVPGSLSEQLAWLYKKELESNFDSFEEPESLQTSIDGLSKIIRDEVANGIPLKRMIIGGYTMGGQIALHVALRFFPEMAGVFGLSTFLPRNTIVYEEMRKQNRTTWPKVYFSQGEEEPSDILPICNWTRETLGKLKKLRVKAEFHIIGEEGGHGLNKKQLQALWNWIGKVIPL